jgi:hypothetical protein
MVHSGDRDFILEFNPATGALTPREARLPSVRYNHSCATNSATGRIYCFGGFSPGPGYGLAEIVEFDPATDAVRLMGAAFPTKIYDTSCVEDSVDHLIYCLGGRGKPISPNYIDLIYVYDPAADTLTEKSAKFLSERFDQSCVENSATNKIYCFGGARNVIDLSEINEYTPALPVTGDVNDSGGVDLTDLVQSLKVVAGSDQEGLERKADVGGNRQLGLEEAIYILRTNAEL